MSDATPGLALLAGLTFIGVGGGFATVAIPRRGLRVQAVGAALLAVGGFAVLADGASLGAGFASSFAPRVGVDPLTGFFLGTLGLVAAAAMWFAADYLRPSGRWVCKKVCVSGVA